MLIKIDFTLLFQGSEISLQYSSRFQNFEEIVKQ